MQEHRYQFRLIRMVTVFEVSRSGYYAWVKRCQYPSAKKRTQQQLDTHVKEVFRLSKQINGARRIQVDLKEQGYVYDIKTIGRSIKRQRLVAKAARKFKVTTDSRHRLPMAPNLLGQNFDADQSNQKWAGDITYHTPVKANFTWLR